MEEPQKNTIEQDASAETLIMEDEKAKEISLEEDILGTQSLLLSESDEVDDDNFNFKDAERPQKKILPNRNKRILDSDSEEDYGNERSAINNGERINETFFDANNDIDKNESKKNESLNKLHMEIDSSVETQEFAIDDFTRHKLKNDSDKVKEKNKAKKQRKNSSQHSGSDSNLDFPKTYKNSLVDSESYDDESEKEISVSELEASAKAANIEENRNAKDTKSKVIRSSAKKAMDEIQAIQSEQQRLHREAQISVPYHKPRKHTLDEFLRRRTIIQPQIASTAIETRNLKMTSEELEEYAKIMEERAKEATEFFKSESENEGEEVLKDNEGVLVSPVKLVDENDTNISKQSHIPNEIAIQESTNTSGEFSKNLDAIQSTKKELTEIFANEENMPHVEEAQEAPTCSKVLITEIIELPKLDMNTVRISPTKQKTPRLSLNIMQLLGEKNLSESPSLSGDPNKLIDLGTGDIIEKKPTGMENLMKRLMLSVKARKSKDAETCNILSVENGKIEMSKVKINRTEANDTSKDSKPGAAYFELKKTLKEIIKKKRLEDINKKQENEVEFNKCLAEDSADDNDESENEFEEYEEIYEKTNEKGVMVDDDENALLFEDTCDEEDDGNEDNFEKSASDEDNKSDAEDYKGDNDIENNAVYMGEYQRKNRIIKRFDDTDEEIDTNDDIDFLKTQPPTTHFCRNEDQKPPLENEKTELLALCSGTFDKTEKTFTHALMSQIPLTQNTGKPTNYEELMDLCSGAFDQPSETLQSTNDQRIPENINIISSDEANDEEQFNKNEKSKQRVKKLTKKLKKNKPKLGFSDDEEQEESENDEDDKQAQDINDQLEIGGEEPQTFIDYDSEENEILVQMTKKDKAKELESFFENEAELSESEWGSADENENNLDKYDIELGDEDQFDREKLRAELGQIHARKMLDEDIREVRKIQEMFFEDEEKDGVGRQRTFKWKNTENGFSLDDGRPLDENGDGRNDDSGDEINEHQWRKIRYEREQFFKEHGLTPDSPDISTVLHNSSIPINNTASNAINRKKLQIVTTKKIALSKSDSKMVSPFLISNGIAAMNKKSGRGSFLVRDKETLNKLAGLTKGTLSSVGVSDMDDAAGTVSVKTIKPNNFVFATLTEEEHKNLKRKTNDILNNSNGNGTNFMKKPKIEPRRGKCLIDQLL